MKKISFNFLNRFERFILKNKSDEYVPISSTIALSTLVGAVIGVLIVFVLQMTTGDETLGPVTLGIAFGGAFLYCSYKIYKILHQFTTIGSKIGFIVYSLCLFAISSLLFLFLVMWALIIALVIGVIILILKLTFGSSGSGKKRKRAYYNDGTTEDFIEDGRGICGETYYKGERGGTHVD